MAAKLSKEDQARYDSLVKYLSGKPDANAIDTGAMLRDLKPAVRDKIWGALPKNLQTRYKELVPNADKQFRAAGRVVTGAAQPAAPTVAPETGGPSTVAADPALPDVGEGTNLELDDPKLIELITKFTQPFIDREKGDNSGRAKEEADINRVDVAGPDGTVKWAVDPITGKYTQTTELSPEMKKLRDGEVGVDQAGVDQAMYLLSQMTGKNYDLNQVGYKMPEENDYKVNFENERQAIEADRARTREPMLQQQRANLETQLLNNGVAPGSSAYATAMRQLEDQQQGQRLTDAEFARTQGQGAANAWRDRTMGNRQQAVSEYDANATRPVDMATGLYNIGKGSQAPVGYAPNNVAVEGTDTLGASFDFLGKLTQDEQYDATTEAQIDQFAKSLGVTKEQLKQTFAIAKMQNDTSKSNNANSVAASKANNAASIAQRKEEQAQAQQNHDDEIAIAVATGARSAPAQAGRSGYSPTGPAGSKSSSQPYQSTVKPRSVFSGGGAF